MHTSNTCEPQKSGKRMGLPFSTLIRVHWYRVVPFVARFRPSGSCVYSRLVLQWVCTRVLSNAKQEELCFWSETNEDILTLKVRTVPP
ncbi:hypothetical protein BaRGS_00008984 [Batillaria attramentaria]|uniref:Uncharacterized protein n=1 Tax=Batillaria attramentaria TaxID=370345 RepID=A0ABD0LJN8_9CAEN